MQPLPTTPTDHLPAPLLHLEPLRVHGCELQTDTRDMGKATGHQKLFLSVSEFLLGVVHGEKKGKVEILGLFWNFL